MTAQLMLSAFSQETISPEEATKDFRPWNKVVLDWDVEYKGYARGKDDEHEGHIDFHVMVHIVEAVVVARDPKTYKKVKAPGYRLFVTQNMAFEDTGEWETYDLYEESFQRKDLGKAVDVFRREVLNVQGWIEIAESRARLIPKGRDAFECPFCGWVTGVWRDDILCKGCGKRFWSEKLWKKGKG